MAKRKVKNEIEAIYGPEPTWESVDDDNYGSILSKCFYWYNNAVKNQSKKKWIYQYATENGYTKEQVSAIPDDYISTLGAACRLYERGFPLNEKSLGWISNKLSELTSKFKPVADTKQVVDPLVEIRKQIELDELIGSAMEPYDICIDRILKGERKVEVPEMQVKLNGVQTKEVTDYFKQIKDEVNLALSGDIEYKEAYPQGRLILKRVSQCIDDIIGKLQLKLMQAKASRPKKPRKVRSVPNSKKVAKLNFMQSSPEFGVNSINPEKIIGAQKLIVFNTKNRQIQIYHSADSQTGLQVKGSTLQNFTDKSFGKTLRKPEVQLPEFATAPRVKTDKLFNSIKAVEKRLTGRINKDCILLKVF